MDRDGVINEIVYWPELGILDSPLNPDQFKLLPEVPEAIQGFNQHNIKVIVVSNQPAIAKGKMTMQLFEEMSAKMKRELMERNARIDGDYYCFHHPEAKLVEYKTNCNCRKPKPGLILQAAKNFDLELSECYAIGDSLTDVIAGDVAGCTTFLIGNLKCDICKYIQDLGVKPNYIVRNLYQAYQIICKR